MTDNILRMIDYERNIKPDTTYKIADVIVLPMIRDKNYLKELKIYKFTAPVYVALFG